MADRQDESPRDERGSPLVAHDPGLAHRPEIDTQSDTLRSGRPRDSWTPLDAKVRDSLSKNAPLDAIGRCRNGGNRPFINRVIG